jgi:mRNA-degrading endonuclease toxin of MazEF toxin-antitoxin module
MAVRRGDIITVGIEQGPRQPIKRRPAVVVQCDRNNPRLNSAVVAMITSNTSLALREPTQVFIDITTADGRQTGLVHNSAVKCENLYTKLQRDMRKIGIMPVALMQQVDEALKASLELS